MNRRSWLLAAGVALALVGAFVFLRSSGGARGDAAEARGGDRERERSHAELAPVAAQEEELAREPDAAGAREPVTKPADEVAATPSEPAAGVLVIEVVDADGALLAGVPVGVELREAGQDRRGNLDVVRATDERGRAAFPDLLAAGKLKYAGFDRAFAALAFPVREPVDVEFDALDPPDEPIRLVAPATGSLAVAIVDADGAPMETWCYVTRDAEAPAGPGLSRPRRHQVYQRGEAAAYPCIELGLQLHAMASPPGYEEVEEAFDGPRTAGEHVSIELRCAEMRPTVIGRLISSTGEPAGAGELQLRAVYTADRDSSQRQTGRIDETGAFRIPLWAVPARVATARVELVLPDGTWAERALPVPLQHGEIDLGDVVLHGAPLLFAGRVVDTAGEPVYWMMVDLAEIRRRDSGPYVGGWPQRATTDHDGRFACYGRVPDGEYALSVFGQGFLRSPLVPLRLGDEHVEIVLRRPGSIAGSLVLGDGVPASWFRIVAEGEPEAAPGDMPAVTNRVEVQPKLDGEFAVPELRPGSIEVRILPVGSQTPILVVDDVLVEDGKETHDPRLQDVDVAGLIGTFRLTVREPDGGAPPRGVVLVRAPGEDAIERALEIRGGELAFFARHASVDVDVLVPGYRAAHVDGLRGAREVVLEPGIEVTLMLADGVELPPDPVELRMGLVPKMLSESFDLEVATAAGEPASFPFYELANLPVVGPSRQVTVVLPWEGEFAPKLYLHSRAEAGGGNGFWPDGYPWRELGAADAGSVIDVVLDAERYKEDVAQQLDR